MQRTRDRLQTPLLLAFRAAAEMGDARKPDEERDETGRRVVVAQHLSRRRMTDELALRRDMAIDLTALMNTIDLGSALDLDGFDHVSASVLNFGIYDVSSITSDDERVDRIASNLAAALSHHEPRLVADSISVLRDHRIDDVTHRVRFRIAAEMICKPLDVPIEFLAEIDMGSGKVELSHL